MKYKHLLVMTTFSLFSISSSANFENTVNGNISNISQQIDWGNMKAISFDIKTNKSLVIECNSTYARVGLSDLNYTGYNEIKPSHNINPTECIDVLNKIKSGQTLIFQWTDLKQCTYGVCKYLTGYSFQ